MNSGDCVWHTAPTHVQAVGYGFSSDRESVRMIPTRTHFSVDSGADLGDSVLWATGGSGPGHASFFFLHSDGDCDRKSSAVCSANGLGMLGFSLY